MKFRPRGVVLVVAIVLVVVLALAFAWGNRGSDKIATAVLAPLVLALGYYLSRWFLPGSEKWVTACVAALVALVGVLAFTPPFDFKRVMRASFIMRLDTREPIFLLGLMAHQVPVTVTAQGAPKGIWKAEKDNGIRLYHHFLQRAILEALLRPELAWGTEVERYSNWGLTFQMKPGATIPGSYLTREFGANRFIAAPFLTYAGDGPALTVPAGTTLSGKVPDEKASGNETGRIRLENRFYTLTIETRFLSSTNGLYGRYAYLTAGKDHDPRLAAIDYMVRVTGTGSRLFAHHPEMPRYTAWMQTIADGLARTFDNEEGWKVFMDHETVRHILGVPR
jgi:hypothetical protein